MSFRGGRGGSSRGGSSFGGRGGRGGYNSAPMGPPDTVQEMGTVMHSCEGEIVCTSTNPKIPYFNAPIYLENKSVVGKVDEILGPMNQVYFTVKPQDGIVATSFKEGDKFYIGPDKLLPLERFLPKPKAATGAKVAKRGGAGGRGGRGGAPRGGRGGFTPRGRGGSSFGGRGGGAGGRGGRGGFTPRGGSGGRGGFTPRGRGGFTPRGR
ncbi:Gar1/Naf1 RNA binding region-domain-containing protein [Pyronema domesticum]|uniref:H/ACA ribonucleoprotein complex subunit n=1 Tax=Pyronema omphalodes (strain CBS 100304) TaxID=1076935 RepID=U4LRK6_PYROM|nr:Gar1/Naf1 RNA binding region-domain-containing protein [Pyronema domesticum]CCX34595.1 Similar to H/ACA ribonucleoprotein complex subunit 1; acc. no. Q1E6M1 [Pyronema omphalodes CBS 100304]